jgi:hypothetical protein
MIYILRLTVSHLPMFEENVSCNQENRRCLYFQFGWSCIRMSLFGYPEHQVAQNLSATFFYSFLGLSMIQMHALRGCYSNYTDLRLVLVSMSMWVGEM